MSTRPFTATIGRFDAPDEQRLMDALTAWVESRYREVLQQRPSMHAYVRTLPGPVIEQVEALRGAERIRAAILEQCAPGTVLVPMTHTDELYISHYNKDGGGDQGLFDKHYDGNLGFLKVVSVVRALIYLQSDASYTVVFADSGVRKAFGTYDFGLLDFHRELHWVEGHYVPGGPQRILLKCNYLLAPPGGGWIVRVAIAANTAVFYVVKAAMEYSKSPSTPPQIVVGWLCNAARRLNNVHPVLPLAVAAAVTSGLLMALVGRLW